MSYEETQEMAAAGARVLNVQAVEFAKEKNIAIYARATAAPPMRTRADGVDGTVVRRHAPRAPGSVAGVVGERDVLALRAAGGDPLAVLGCLEEHGACGKQVHALGEELALVLSRENLHGEAALREALARCAPGARLEAGLGAVSAVGTGINATHANLLAGTRALRNAGIAPAGLATSGFRITWLLPDARTDDAVRALHRLFVESTGQPVP